MAEDAATNNSKNSIDKKLSVTSLGGSIVSHVTILDTILTAMKSDKLNSFRTIPGIRKTMYGVTALGEICLHLGVTYMVLKKAHADEPSEPLLKLFLFTCVNTCISYLMIFIFSPPEAYVFVACWGFIFIITLSPQSKFFNTYKNRASDHMCLFLFI
ncbi:hypothetical protein QL285_083182 [Trifolium repens]|jgi:hypothetical protein|nr:hypothetical protein QL285_083182 [Trifolium repens]